MPKAHSDQFSISSTKLAAQIQGRSLMQTNLLDWKSAIHASKSIHEKTKQELEKFELTQITLGQAGNWPHGKEGGEDIVFIKLNLLSL